MSFQEIIILLERFDIRVSFEKKEKCKKKDLLNLLNLQDEKDYILIDQPEDEFLKENEK